MQSLKAGVARHLHGRRYLGHIHRACARSMQHDLTASTSMQRHASQERSTCNSDICAVDTFWLRSLAVPACNADRSSASPRSTANDNDHASVAADTTGLVSRRVAAGSLSPEHVAGVSWRGERQQCWLHDFDAVSMGKDDLDNDLARKNRRRGSRRRRKGRENGDRNDTCGLACLGASSVSLGVVLVYAARKWT